MVNINISHLFLAFFIIWTKVVSVGKTYRLYPACVLAVRNNESVFATFYQQSFSCVLFFFLFAALKINHFHTWFGKTEVSLVTSPSETI